MGAQSSIVLWRDIHEIADKVCAQFNLTYGKILPETRKRARFYGEATACTKCRNSPTADELNCKEKVLRIRINQFNKNNTPLATSTIIRTLAHELAHLRYWYHTPAHKRFESEIIQFIKDLGYSI